MYNLTPERKNMHTKGRGNGYVVTMGGKRIYISGDTEDIPEMRELKNIDVAFVCMNLPYTMDVDHAADAVLAFKPRLVYPYHYRGKEQMSDVEQFKKLVALAPKDPFGYANLGLTYLQAGSFADAEKQLKRARELDPANAERLKTPSKDWIVNAVRRVCNANGHTNGQASGS